jgi:predicted nucleotidyltransferase
MVKKNHLPHTTEKLIGPILAEIKNLVVGSIPGAKVLLYGSYARGNPNLESDIDLMLVVPGVNLNYKEEAQLVNPLYDLEIKRGIIISPFVVSVSDWKARKKFVPFYMEIEKEGVEI